MKMKGVVHENENVNFNINNHKNKTGPEKRKSTPTTTTIPPVVPQIIKHEHLRKEKKRKELMFSKPNAQRAQNDLEF